MTTLAENFKKITELKMELLELKQKYHKTKKELIDKISKSENSRDAKLKKLLFKECEESPEGHHFIDNSGTDSQSGRDMEESKICTKCGFEKKA